MKVDKKNKKIILSLDEAKHILDYAKRTQDVMELTQDFIKDLKKDIDKRVALGEEFKKIKSSLLQLKGIASIAPPDVPKIAIPKLIEEITKAKKKVIEK